MKNYMICSALLVSLAPAYAHVPYVEGLDFSDSYQVSAPVEKSLAIYMNFDNVDDVDELQVNLSEADLQADNPDVVEDAQGRLGRKFSFNSIVPRCRANSEVFPKLALVGPAQDALVKPAGSEGLPLNIAADQGIFVLENSERGDEFKENFSGTFYWQGPSAEIIVTEPGIYRLYAWSPDQALGDYVLVFGAKEIFGPAEIEQSIKRLDYLRKGLEIKDPGCRKEAKIQARPAST